MQTTEWHSKAIGHKKTTSKLAGYWMGCASLAVAVSLSSCAPLQQYSTENGFEFRDKLGGDTTIAKMDKTPLPQATAFVKHEVSNEKSDIVFTREIKGTINFLVFSIGPKYSIKIDKGYIRSAKAIYPKGVLPAGTSNKIIYSELGTGVYQEEIGATGTFQIDDPNKSPDRIVGLKSKTFKASEPQTITLMKGAPPTDQTPGVNIKYDSVYMDGETPVANIHIIALPPGTTQPAAWNSNPGQTPKLRHAGNAEGTANGLSWNAAKGLVDVQGFEHRLPIITASSNEDAAVVKVTEDDYLVVQLNSIGNNLDAAVLTLQRVTAN